MSKHFAISDRYAEKHFAISDRYAEKYFAISDNCTIFAADSQIIRTMIFRRKLYNEMLRWKTEHNGQSALLIKGARRVGKSTLVEEFARNEYKSYILIDFSRVSKQVNALFEDMSDLDFFFLHLQTEMRVTLHRRNSVIIFDEVQRQPLARQAIKHLVKDGRYDYIETGSLLSIKKNIKDIVIPSEETRLTLHPMDFEEFLWAVGNDTTMQMLRQFYARKIALGLSHRQMMRDFRLYMLVGGMPQAVDEYLRVNNLQLVDRVKRNILDLYEEDFRKIDPTGRASKLFAAIPGQLTSNASRFQVGSIDENQRPSRVAELVADMEDSMTINMAYRVNDPNVGMGLFKDFEHYKMFLADTGLFVTLAFRDKSFTDNVIYNKLLSDKLEANLGYVYENVVAQMLKASGNELFYYSFSDGNNHNYEVDFLLSRGNKICPIEVKSSGYKSHKSLDVFCDRFSSRIGSRYLVYTRDYQRDGQTECLPVYMTPLL